MANNLQVLARNGDIKALESLMNKALSSQSMTVRVTSTGNLLKILLRGIEPPDQKLAEQIQAGLRKLQPKGFTKVKVSAKTTKPDKTIWIAKWALAETSSLQFQDCKNQSARASLGRILLASGTGLVLLVLAAIGYRSFDSTSTAQSPTGTDPLSADNPQAADNSPPQTPEESTSEQPASDPEVNPFGDAVNAAMAAAEATQTANTAEEWREVAALWRQAIELMKAVSADSDNYSTAQQKVIEYQSNLEYAEQNAIAGTPASQP